MIVSLAMAKPKAKAKTKPKAKPKARTTAKRAAPAKRKPAKKPAKRATKSARKPRAASQETVELTTADIVYEQWLEPTGEQPVQPAASEPPAPARGLGATVAKVARAIGSVFTTKKSPLDELQVAFARRDGDAALSAALVWWQAERAPVLADLIDAISQHVSAAPVGDAARWTELAAAKDPRDLGALLAGVPALPAKALPAAAEALAAFPDDPRLASAVARWVLDPPAPASSPFWTTLLARVEQLGDRRVIERFAACSDKKLRKALDTTSAKLSLQPESTIAEPPVAVLASHVEALQRRQ